MRVISVTLAGLLLFACGEAYDAAPDFAPPLEDVLTLGLSFGDDESLGEFLLARPFGMDVSNDIHIFIADEYSVKIYDEYGKPITRVGGQGQGPGEFDLFSLAPAVSNAGLLTAHTGIIYNLYQKRDNDSDVYSFVRKNYLYADDRYTGFWNRLHFIQQSQDRFHPIRDDIIITHMSGIDESFYAASTNNVTEEKLIHFIAVERPDSLIPIVSIHSFENFRQGPRIAWKPFYGKFFWQINSDSTLVYCHTGVDKNNQERSFEYSIRIRSLFTEDSLLVTHHYTPVTIPDSSR